MKIFLSLVLSFISFMSFAEISVELNSNKSVEYHSYNFGTVPVNSRTPISYKVTNTGESALTFHSATISGMGFDAYHTCKKGLQPKEVCTFTIYYWPSFEGMSSGRFRINFDPESDIVVDLWGNATR